MREVPTCGTQRSNVELIVIADDTQAVIADLNTALDQLDERHTIFDGGIETIAVNHRGTRKRSALAHTLVAGETASAAVRAAGGGSVAAALRTII
jgi:hypothetical protein